MLLFRNSTTLSLFLCRVRTAQCPAFTNAVAFAYHSSRLAVGLYTIGLFFYKFISLMPDDRREGKRKSNSKNRNAIWRTFD